MTALVLAPISHSLPVMARRRPPDAALVPRTRNRPGELDRFDLGARLLHAPLSSDSWRGEAGLHSIYSRRTRYAWWRWAQNAADERD